MPPALHPRSGFTMSLFTTTLALSFVVVGLPHLVSCPVDSSQYAEGSLDHATQTGNGARRQRRRRRLPPRHDQAQAATAEDGEVGERATADAMQDDVQKEAARRVRECPVPKPGGLLGQLLGFREREAGGGTPEVKVRGVVGENALSGEEGDQ